MDKISKIFLFDTSNLIFTVNIPKQPQNKSRKNKKNEKSRKFISRENHLFFHSRKYIPKISRFFTSRNLLPAKVFPHKVVKIKFRKVLRFLALNRKVKYDLK